MIYVTSDLHGYPLEKFKAYLQQAGFCERDTLYILGDVVDRGADGVRILQWIMRTPNVKMILGNHEDMMLKCEFLFMGDTALAMQNMQGLNYASYAGWAANGGTMTIDAMCALRERECDKIYEFLHSLPLYEEVSVNGRDFLLVHAGLGGFSSEKKLSEYTKFDLVWNRPTILDRYYKDKITVFGHTPTVNYSAIYEGKAIKTDTWINVDVGAGFGYAPMLLRLDDLKEFYFDRD